MLVRIVKMKFEPENLSQFMSIFEESKQAIRSFKGCNFLELYQDQHDATVFFTYSFWEKESDLEAYRNSNFFKSVWAKTKILFADKPEAWSLNKMVSLA